MINLNRLVGLVWVARHESYARAARAFPYPITQPGLHQQVRRLEEELGVALFERVAVDRVVPTPAARALLERCEPFFAELDQAVDAIRGGAAGLLRVEASALVLRRLVAGWARALRRRAPDVALRLAEIQRPTAARVLSGEVDLLVDFVPDPPAGVASRQVGEAVAYLVVPRAGAGKRAPRLADMGERDFVAYPKETIHRTLQQRALEQAGAAPRQIITVGSADSILALVGAGLGYSLIPWIGSRPPRHAGVVASRQRGAAARFPIAALWRASQAGDPILEAALALFSF